jgi:hypothetical protein
MGKTPNNSVPDVLDNHQSGVKGAQLAWVRTTPGIVKRM